MREHLKVTLGVFQADHKRASEQLEKLRVEYEAICARGQEIVKEQDELGTRKYRLEAAIEAMCEELEKAT